MEQEVQKEIEVVKNAVKVLRETLGKLDGWTGLTNPVEDAIATLDNAVTETATDPYIKDAA